MKFWIVVGLIVMQAPSSLAFFIVGNYNAAAMGVIAFVVGCMFGYAASLHLEQPQQPKPPAPRVDSQPTQPRRELVIYEVTGKEML